MTRLAPARVDGLGREPELDGLFDRLNAHHFGATLPHVVVRRGVPNDPTRDAPVLAVCRRSVLGGPVETVVFAIFLAELLFTAPMPDPRSRWREIASCLLHEMVHMAVDLDEIGSRYTDDIEDHGQEFANECNRIGRAAGWSHVTSAEKAFTDREDARWWPLDDACDTCVVVGSSCQAGKSTDASVTKRGVER